MMKRKLCIGLTGRMGSGKGEAAAILHEYGFNYISLSDIVREEVDRRGKMADRSQMQDIGNSMRKVGGAGILGRLVREKITASDQDKWAIDGIRNPAEVSELRKIDAFYLLGIEARLSIILTRLKSRKRDDDEAGDADLKKRLDREWGIGEPGEGQQVGRCMDLADFTITNENTLSDLRREILRLINIVS